VSCGVPAVLPSIRCGARTRPSAAAGALVTKFAAAAHFARSHFPRVRHLPLVAASARVLHKIGLPGAARVVRSQPCALRMHAKADTNSHGRIPTRACGDLPHWRSTIRSKDGQYLILPRGAAFEAISGEGHRILLATGAAAQPDLAGNAQCHFIAGAALPTKHTTMHLFRRELGCLQRLRRSAAAQRRDPCPGAGKCCRTERVRCWCCGRMQRERS
jgi:hypothetical protein